MKIGSIVALKNNPFIVDEDIMPFISGEFNFTPPFMVVAEVLYPNTPIVNTLPNQINCIFFSEKENRFKTAWFGFDQLKLIEKTDSYIYNYSDIKGIEKSLFEMKQNGQQFVLLSTDKELNKEKINQTKETDSLKKAINNFYNNLPPVLTAIDFRRREDKKESLLKIGYKYEIKCKWFNHKEDKYSEEFIPLETLKPVEIKIDESLVNFLREKNSLFLGLNPVFKRHNIEFEVNGQSYSYHPILKFERIRFNHYKYYIDFLNVFNKNVISVNVDKLIESSLEDLDNKYKSYYKSFNKKANKGWSDSDNNQLMTANMLKFSPIFKKIYDVFYNETDDLAEDFYFDDGTFDYESLIGQFITIQYLDESNKKTFRSIYVTSISVVNSFKNQNEDNNSYILTGNCFLRNGKVRHFYTERIKSITKLSFNGFDEFSGLSIQEWLSSSVDHIIKSK